MRINLMASFFVLKFAVAGNPRLDNLVYKLLSLQMQGMTAVVLQCCQVVKLGIEAEVVTALHNAGVYLQTVEPLNLAHKRL